MPACLSATAALSSYRSAAPTAAAAAVAAAAGTDLHPGTNQQGRCGAAAQHQVRLPLLGAEGGRHRARTELAELHDLPGHRQPNAQLAQRGQPGGGGAALAGLEDGAVLCRG